MNCVRCGQDFPFTAEFFKKNKSCRSGMERVCRACKKKYLIEWRKANPDKVGAIYARAEAKRKLLPPGTTRCRDKEKEAKRVREYKLRVKFGISSEEYERRHKAQGGVCAICQGLSTRRYFDVDHDHHTREFRGLLCSPCNTSLGLLRERVDLFEAAIRYLKSFSEARSGAEEKLIPFQRGGVS